MSIPHNLFKCSLSSLLESYSLIFFLAISHLIQELAKVVWEGFMQMGLCRGREREIRSRFLEFVSPFGSRIGSEMMVW